MKSFLQLTRLKVWLELEYFLGDFDVFPFYPLQLQPPLHDVQTLCAGLDTYITLALALLR